jgi:hypothetical protein
MPALLKMLSHGKVENITLDLVLYIKSQCEASPPPPPSQNRATKYTVNFLPLLSHPQQGLCVALAVLGLTLDQADLKPRDSPASASQVLRLKVCATTWLTLKF